MNQSLSSTIERLPRSVSLAVFRLHIENGIAVSIGIGIVALSVFSLFGLHDAVAAATGALIVSIVDRPEPLVRKPKHLARALIPGFIFTALALVAEPWPIAALAVTALTGFTAGMFSAYGKPGISLGGATILSFAFAASAPVDSIDGIARHMAFFLAGGVIYAGYAMNVARLFDDRTRRLLLGEATRAFANYLKAKGELLDPDSEGSTAFRGLIETHSLLAERLQACRDAIFTRRRGNVQMHRVDALIALLDAVELSVSSDADIQLLRRSQHHHLMRRLRNLTLALAQDVEELTHQLRAHSAQHTLKPHLKEEHNILAEIARLEAAANPEDENELNTLSGFRITFNKIRRSEAAIIRLGSTFDPATPISDTAANLDLTPFTQSAPSGFSVITAQLNLRSPAFRYALRLSLAMTVALAITHLYGNFHHGSWVVVTTALIMRANYSLTSQRRWQRVTGTLAGCVMAALVGHFVAPEWIVPIIIVSIGISHAYALVDFRITAAFASVNALLLLHLLEPAADQLFIERMLDTLLGAVLSYFFSFLLPNWERTYLPQAVTRLLKSDLAYAKQALNRAPNDLQYRLARKNAQDAVAALADSVRRMADEPNTDKAVLATLNELLGASYLLVSDLASVHVITIARASELDSEKADLLLTEAYESLALILSGTAVTAGTDDNKLRRRGFSAFQSRNGMNVLRRRLIHVERVAQRVARLAQANLAPTTQR